METNTNQITHLPRFNEVIHIAVPLQQIFEKLKETFPADYKHAESVSHAIVGSAVSNGGISYIYNALNGYTNEIDFKGGDVVVCTAKARKERYDANKEDEEGNPITSFELVEAEADYQPDWQLRAAAIGECKVLGINLYANDKLTVQYSHQNKDGTLTKTIRDVDHRTCTKIPGPILLIVK